MDNVLAADSRDGVRETACAARSVPCCDGAGRATLGSTAPARQQFSDDPLTLGARDQEHLQDSCPPGDSAAGALSPGPLRQRRRQRRGLIWRMGTDGSGRFRPAAPALSRASRVERRVSESTLRILLQPKRSSTSPNAPAQESRPNPRGSVFGTPYRYKNASNGQKNICGMWTSCDSVKSASQPSQSTLPAAGTAGRRAVQSSSAISTHRTTSRLPPALSRSRCTTGREDL